ncbi:MULTISPECIES: PAS domain-containing sensor histidine kinase [Desulfococcus]|nr:PAS domain S-box protein [Desulfococcus multivorans]AOY58586.1 two component system sensor histidine kinase [Desulfococcus multivorans]MDX9818806.1 PAS domain S-box protein [Desulfococcus multivorans]
MTSKSRSHQLRARAEELLNDRLSWSSRNSGTDSDAVQRELLLCQIELELRNSELTARHQTLERLQDHYHALFDYAPVAAMTLTADGELIEANHAAADLLQAEKGSLSGGRFERFIRPGDRRRFRLHLERVFGGGGRRICELEMRKTDGTVFFGQIISLRYDSGGESQCQTLVIDISYRKRFEAEMEDRIDGRTRELNALNMQLEQEIEWRKQTEERLDSELNFRTIIEESIPVGICVFDTNGRLIHANSHLCDMLGFSRDELINIYPPYPFWPEDDMLSRMEELKNFIERDDVSENVIREYRKKNGERLWGLTSRIKMKDYHGKRYGILGSVFDITPRKKIEEELRLSERKLRALSVKLMEAGESERKRISKELHDSVGSALTAVQFAMERKVGEMDGRPCEKKTCLEDILLMIHTIADEVRRISKNLHPSVLEDLGIKAALRAYGRQFQKLYRNIALDQIVDMDESAVPGYLKLLIYRIVQESLNNAVKHGGADHVRLELRQNDNTLDLVVRDNGRGFDLQEIQKRNLGIGGLGLESMKERTEHAGGMFEVSSAPGVGTRIRAAWTLDPPEASGDP